MFKFMALGDSVHLHLLAPLLLGTCRKKASWEEVMVEEAGYSTAARKPGRERGERRGKGDVDKRDFSKAFSDLLYLTRLRELTLTDPRAS